MAEPPHFVVDNSAAAKWALRTPDEPFLAEATMTLDDFLTGRIGLLAPYLLAYELGSTLRLAARRRRITEEQSARELIAFFSLGIPLHQNNDLLRRALELSARFGAAYSDSVYLALAEAARLPLIHADERLRNALAGRFQYELWLGHYR